MIAVSDTGPLRNLSLLRLPHLLGELFERVLVPRAVYTELTHAHSPQIAADVFSKPPHWLTIEETDSDSVSWPHLGAGERAALTLAQSLSVDVLLTDDLQARSMAKTITAVAVSGTIGVLYLATQIPSVGFVADDFDRATDQLLNDPEIRFHAGLKLRLAIRQLSVTLRRR